jgi:putative transposase
MTRPSWHSRGYLPHCDEDHLVQHIVCRLADSLPSTVLQRMELLNNIERFSQCDRFLDSGAGSSTLREPGAAQIVVEPLWWFDAQRYALLAWCVMPNHVHIVIEPLAEHTLSQIIKSLKAYTAAKINRTIGRSGRLWAADYFDRFMRSNEHLSTTIAYVESNPVAAGLCARPADWPFSSAAERKMRV